MWLVGWSQGFEIWHIDWGSFECILQWNLSPLWMWHRVCIIFYHCNKRVDFWCVPEGSRERERTHLIDQQIWCMTFENILEKAKTAGYYKPQPLLSKKVLELNDKSPMFRTFILQSAMLWIWSSRFLFICPQVYPSLSNSQILIMATIVFEKNVGKSRKCWLPAFSPFPTMFFYSSKRQIQ